jgi:hypothetical protein
MDHSCRQPFVFRELGHNWAMKRFRSWILTVIFASAFFIPARAWENGGHLLIADVVSQHLNPAAKAEVERLAEQLPHSGASYNFITIVYWMDDIKSDQAVPDYGMFKSWHYIDLPIDASGPMPSFEPGDDNEQHGNIVQALKRAVVVLKGGTDPYVKDKATACAMVMHLVGDIHQPLHCATKYFFSHGQLFNDRGGNGDSVVNTDVPLNLHFFWDQAYKASLDQTTGNVIFEHRWVDSFHEALPYPPDDKASLEPDFEGWARESNAIARDFAYRDLTEAGDNKHCRLSSAYVDKARAIAQKQLLLASWRLATLLNETLGAPQPAPPPPSYPAGPPAQAPL